MWDMDTVLDMLANTDHEYQFIYHEKPIFTAQQGADYFNIEIGQTAPTLIIKTDIGFYALVISGNRTRVDFEKIKILLGCEQANMASRKEVKKLTGFDVGSIPMIGINFPYILDKKIFSYTYVYGGSGQATRTLKISPNILRMLNEVIAIMDY